MCVWFFVCTLGTIATVPLHFLSVEHLRLQEKYGSRKGIKIGEICGLVSGWGFFLFWMGMWASPQPRFILPVVQNLLIPLMLTNLSVPLVHFLIFVFFVVPSLWLAIKGVKETSLKVAETHRTEKIVTGGVYSIVRHPQYLGGLLAHVGISFILSAWYSLLSTPFMIALVYLMSKKEEQELIREFDKEYEDYRAKVPMLLPSVKVSRTPSS